MVSLKYAFGTIEFSGLNRINDLLVVGLRVTECVGSIGILILVAGEIISKGLVKMDEEIIPR